jgi:hypothetical protein
MIGALGSPLGPHSKSDLTIDLYSDSTLIAIMDESNHRISLNHLNKSMSSLLAVIEALDSPLGPHSESDLLTDLYSDSTPIAIMDKSDRRISFNCLNKSTSLLPGAIGALDSPLGPHLESDLV